MLKKRTVVISVLLAVCLVGQLFLRSNLCRAGEDTTRTDKSSSEGKGELSTWSLDDLDLDKGTSRAQSNLMRQFALAIGFVVLLGCGAWYVSKKFGPKLAITRGKEVRITETIHLGTHRALHMVEVGGRHKFLIGSTNTNINILADVSEEVSSRLTEEVI